MKLNLKQLSFANIYIEFDEYFQQDKPKLIKFFDSIVIFFTNFIEEFCN